MTNAAPRSKSTIPAIILPFLVAIPAPRIDKVPRIIAGPFAVHLIPSSAASCWDHASDLAGSCPAALAAVVFPVARQCVAYRRHQAAAGRRSARQEYQA